MKYYHIILPYNIEELKILHYDEYIKNNIQEIIDLFLVKFNNKTIIFFNKLLLIENKIKNPDILLNHNLYNISPPLLIINCNFTCEPYNLSLELPSCKLKVNYNIILQNIKKKNPLNITTISTFSDRKLS